MNKITDVQVNDWLKTNNLATTADAREHILETMEKLRAGKISVAGANREFRYARAALRRLKAQLTRRRA